MWHLIVSGNVFIFHVIVLILIFSGFYTPLWWRVQDHKHQCTVEQLEEAIQGYFTADALPLSITGRPGLSGIVSTV